LGAGRLTLPRIQAFDRSTKAVGGRYNFGSTQIPLPPKRYYFPPNRIEPMLSAPTQSFPVIITLLLTHVTFGQEWGRFRGPNGEGISPATTIPVRWTEDDYHWRTELPCIGYSSPVVNGSRLFITSALEESATQIVCCLSTDEGKTLWQKKFESIVHEHHQFNCFASSTPALDADALYFLWANPEQLTVVKLAQTTGEELWRRELGTFEAEHAVGASPIVYQDLVIVPNEQDGESSIVALDRETGEVRWESKRRTEKTAYATPCVFTPSAGPTQLLVNSWAHGFSGLAPETGKLLWELPVFKYRVVGSPVMCAGLVFGSAGSGGVGRQMFAVRPGEPQRSIEAEVAYELNGSLPYVVTPMACGDLLFAWFDKGVVTCLEAASGEIVWRERIGGDYFGSPVCVNGNLYCISREGEMVVLAASREFKELGRIDLGEPSNSTPAVADGVMYVRTKSHIMALGGE